MVRDVLHRVLSRLRLNPHKYLQSSRVHEPPSPGVGSHRWTPCLPRYLPEVVSIYRSPDPPSRRRKGLVSFANRYQDIWMLSQVGRDIWDRALA